MAGRKLKLAMAGGGEGAFIGGVHRMAAALDGDWELVAGAFSSDPARNWRAGGPLGLDPARVHDTLDALLADERARPEAPRRRRSRAGRWRGDAAIARWRDRRPTAAATRS